jgi:hypothetical protein
MSMTENDFKDRDEQAAWELLGRHKSIEPSFGFVDRTLRRLHEAPTQRWRWPVLRWASVASLLMIALSAGLFVRHRQVKTSQEVALYQSVTQDQLEDFDVIACLDQLEGKNQL